MSHKWFIWFILKLRNILSHHLLSLQLLVCAVFPFTNLTLILETFAKPLWFVTASCTTRTCSFYDFFWTFLLNYFWGYLLGKQVQISIVQLSLNSKRYVLRLLVLLRVFFCIGLMIIQQQLIQEWRMLINWGFRKRPWIFREEARLY